MDEGRPCEELEGCQLRTGRLYDSMIRQVADASALRAFEKLAATKGSIGFPLQTEGEAQTPTTPDGYATSHHRGQPHRRHAASPEEDRRFRSATVLARSQPCQVRR